MSGSDDIAGLLERYRGEGRSERGYPDLHDHVLALHRAGLLIVVDEPINKDTEMHPLVRWQYRGGIAETDRRAFLFKPPTAKPHVTTSPSWSRGSPPIPKSTASALAARLRRSAPPG